MRWLETYSVKIIQSPIQNKTNYRLEGIIDSFVTELIGGLVTVNPKEDRLCRRLINKFWKELTRNSDQLDLPFDQTELQSWIEHQDWSSVAKVIDDSAKRAGHTLKCVLILFTIYGIELSEKVVGSLRVNFYMLLLLDLYNSSEEMLKWSTAYHLAKCLKQETYRSLPRRPAWKRTNRTFLGQLERCLQRLVHSGLDFCWSYNFLKKGCPPLRYQKVYESIQKHKNIMTDKGYADQSVVDSVSLIIKKLLKNKKTKKQLNKPFKIPTPSLNAGYSSHSARPKGGNRNHIRMVLEEEFAKYVVQHGNGWENGLNPKSEVVVLHLPKQIIEDPRYYHLDPVSLETYVNLKFWEDDFEPTHQVRFIETSESFDAPTVVNISTADQWSLLEKRILADYGDLPEEFDDYDYQAVMAGVVALKEPFKVRIITRSDSLVNYYGIPLQKKLMKLLRKNPVFELMGKPLDLKIIQKCYTNVPIHHFLVSGDYSAATDNIFMNVSEAALKAVLSQMDISLASKQVLLKTMVGQTLDYKSTLSGFEKDPTYPKSQLIEEHGKLKCSAPILYDENGSRNHIFKQTRGQLMGSILSFQILCMINYAMFCMAVAEYLGIDEEDVTSQMCDEQFGLRINGDDISFHGPQEFIAIWTRTFPLSGLTESIGKNFVSPNKITINSKMFSGTRLDNNTIQWKEHVYVNLGLLLCSSPYVVEKDAKRSYELLKSLEAIQKDYLRMPEGRMDRGIKNKDLYNDFIFWNIDILQETKSVNWFLPKWAGGLGLKSEDNIIYNAAQQRVATMALTRNTVQGVRSFKLGCPYSVLPEVTKQMTRLSNELSDAAEPYVSNTYDETDEEDDILRELVQFEPYTNILTEKTLKTQYKFTKKDYERFLKSISSSFSKNVVYSSLSLLSDEKMQELAKGNLPHPNIYHKEPYYITSQFDKVNYE